MVPKELQADLNNINISNYKEIYNKYKDIFDKNDEVFNIYVEKLEDLINELNKNGEYKLCVEVGLFLLDVLGVESLLIWEFDAEGSVKFLTIHNGVLYAG